LAKVAYRHSPSFKSNEIALATWLRLGELDAEQQECADYSETQFKLAVKQIRDPHARTRRASHSPRTSSAMRLVLRSLWCRR
jgi:hypothetical protein